jgi:hypothetical protein
MTTRVHSPSGQYYAEREEFDELERRVEALEAKAKDAPPAQVPPSRAQAPPEHDYAICLCHSKPWESDRIPSERSEYGWRAREENIRWFEDGGTVIGKMGRAVEIHPRAVRVRMHRYVGGPGTYGPGTWQECTQPIPHVAGDGTFESVEHAEFLQISSGPAVKGGSNG